MASFSHTMRQLARLIPPAQTRAQCCRSFSSTPTRPSGHNKWSKIKHEKAAADIKISQQRAYLARHIVLCSKQYGEGSPELAEMVARAKKAGMPKDKIEAAVARGQGRSPEGVLLESVVYEAIFPPGSTAIIIECQTGNRLRTLQDLGANIRKFGGASSSSKFFFTREGRVVFDKGESGLDPDSIMDDAIEAGAEDIDTDRDGNIMVLTSPTDTAQVAQAISQKHGLKVLSSKIVWAANKDTQVKLDSSPETESLIGLLDVLDEMPDVQAVYANVDRGDMSDEEWERIARNIDW